jgi:uncharacterized ion transporter superfamily protein YfcC
MSEHHQHTEFLKHCLRYDDSSERHQMMEKLVRLQHELRIFRRACWLMLLLFILSVAGFVWSSPVLQHFSQAAQMTIVNLLAALGLGSVVSLLTFVLIEQRLRKKLARQREECHQFLKRILAARLETNSDK